jgi:hypothetical protein
VELDKSRTEFRAYLAKQEMVEHKSIQSVVESSVFEDKGKTIESSNKNLQIENDKLKMEFKTLQQIAGIDFIPGETKVLFD